MENVISLPHTALTEEQGSFFVYLQVDEEGYKKQLVTLGADNGERVQILSGVKAGDKVVTQGAYQVKLAGATNAIPAHSPRTLNSTVMFHRMSNIALLADAVGLDITVDETESSVGDFNVDIFASETGTDRKIIIENQLEDTNHDHLGKLIYASGKSADVIIWVVKHAREEHKAAIEWLNNHTDEKVGFFFVRSAVSNRQFGTN